MPTGKLFSRISLLATLTVAALLSVSANAMKLKSQNLAELVTASESILLGHVVSVTDGFQNNAPYTEVTIRVGSDAKGKVKEDTEYTFRQFGLLKPRSMGNGKVYLGVTPEGFAKWHEGEQVVAFMYKKASMTGFQTTAGMAQGKFVVSNDQVKNAFNNAGLFERMDTSNMSAEEQNMITSPGAVSSATFMGYVGKLVEESKK
ncbi:hypothetical protein AWR36_011320 [Microbulbifer flavimaris]|uniref:FMN-binding domain-containing protein n=1 Tax=Microbulbifer flavimaris TaxID=1781068 RepID=A0ABX4HZJ3_9GAMM|nr:MULTISPECIES: hypothetical protein [Microbulbifer]KUJ83114.1 hypothetical protein AVO43_11295 [Microbulbifer sp. ZGT114]PCO05301.1 hypothetical protein AWR36_011320 [Microbulbifer flavimaris]